MFIYNAAYRQLLMIITLGFGVTLTATFFWYLVHTFGKNSKHLCMYLTVIDVYNLSTERWHFLEEYIFVIVWFTVEVTVTAAIFWCIVHNFGDNSKLEYMDLIVTDIYIMLMLTSCMVTLC